MKRPLFFPLLLLIALILLGDLFLPLPSPDPALLNRPLNFEGTILKNPAFKEGKSKLAVALEGGQKILLTTLFEIPSLHKGDTIRFLTTLKKPRHFVNPGGFDYRRYLAHQRIEATGFIEDPSQLVTVKQTPPSFFTRVGNQLKQEASAHLSRLGTIPSQGILRAVLWGDESQLDPPTEKMFRNNGLTHLLVISGMQFGAIALILYQLLITLFKIYPKSFLHLPTRKIAASLTLVFLTFYYFLCEPSPSLTRGYIAVTFYLIALILDRPKDWLNILFLAALVILILNPADLFDLSFQFSFVSVLSLLLIYPKLNLLTRWNGWLEGAGGKWIFEALLLQLSLLIGLTPLILFYFYTFQWTGIFMNLWAVPVVELVIVPLGLIGLFFSFLSFPFFWSALKLSDGVLWILTKAENYFHPPFLVFPPHAWELFLYYALMGILLLPLKKPMKKRLASICLFIFLVDVGMNVHAAFFANKFSITQIDVGQGDSLLVELPGSKHILVDGGGSRYFDIGENVLTPFLLYKRISSLDAITITHADSDHYGGIQSVLEHFRVKELWWNGVPDENPNYQKILETARQKGIPVVVLERGMTKSFDDQKTITVLNPLATEKEGASDNNRGIVLKIEAKNSSALLTADLEAFGEKRLLTNYQACLIGSCPAFPPRQSSFASGSLRSGGGPPPGVPPNQANLLKSDYLKLGHHGSKSSSSEEFLNAVDPQIATIGVGENNPFHHPHPSILRRLEAHTIPYYRTDLNGAIEVELNEGKVKVRPTVDRASPTK